MPGPPPAGDYYWGDAGIFWTSLLNYWQSTGDDSYNDIVTEALLFQSGGDKAGDKTAYLPSNYSMTEGNDDQGVWALAALTAAEYRLPFPPGTSFTSWIDLAESVFNQQVARWRQDNSCGGGLRWQISFTNAGYNYKNSISNGYFLNMGARLAAYTKNDTYASWAGKAWDWMVDTKLIDNATYSVYDGVNVEADDGKPGGCGDISKFEFTETHAAIAHGVAVLANYVSE